MESEDDILMASDPDLSLNISETEAAGLLASGDESQMSPKGKPVSTPEPSLRSHPGPSGVLETGMEPVGRLEGSGQGHSQAVKTGELLGAGLEMVRPPSQSRSGYSNKEWQRKNLRKRPHSKRSKAQQQRSRVRLYQKWRAHEDRRETLIEIVKSFKGSGKLKLTDRFQKPSATETSNSRYDVHIDCDTAGPHARLGLEASVPIGPVHVDWSGVREGLVQRVSLSMIPAGAEDDPQVVAPVELPRMDQLEEMRRWTRETSRSGRLDSRACKRIYRSDKAEWGTTWWLSSRPGIPYEIPRPSWDQTIRRNIPIYPRREFTEEQMHVRQELRQVQQRRNISLFDLSFTKQRTRLYERPAQDFMARNDELTKSMRPEAWDDRLTRMQGEKFHVASSRAEFALASGVLLQDVEKVPLVSFDIESWPDKVDKGESKITYILFGTGECNVIVFDVHSLACAFSLDSNTQRFLRLLLGEPICSMLEDPMVTKVGSAIGKDKVTGVNVVNMLDVQTLWPKLVHLGVFKGVGNKKGLGIMSYRILGYSLKPGRPDEYAQSFEVDGYPNSWPRYRSWVVYFQRGPGLPDYFKLYLLLDAVVPVLLVRRAVEWGVRVGLIYLSRRGITRAALEKLVERVPLATDEYVVKLPDTLAEEQSCRVQPCESLLREAERCVLCLQRHATEKCRILGTDKSNCQYTLCRSSLLHETSGCPTLHGFCLRCNCRGHQIVPGCADDLNVWRELRDAFERSADLGVLTSMRFERPSMGFYRLSSHAEGMVDYGKLREASLALAEVLIREAEEAGNVSTSRMDE